MDLKKSLYYRAKHYVEEYELNETKKENHLYGCGEVDSSVITTLDSVSVYFNEANVFIDIGTYMGAFSRAASAYHPFHTTICIEPNKDLHKIINKNLKGLNYRLVDVALAEKKGDAPYFIHEDRSMNSIIQSDPSILAEEFKWDNPDLMSETTVKTDTLDSILSGQNLGDAKFFIKVDTQGTELNILKGGIEVLKKTEVVLIEQMFFTPYDSDYSFKDVITFMDEQGFECKGAQNIRVRPSKKISGVDFIFVRKDAGEARTFSPSIFDEIDGRSALMNAYPTKDRVQFKKRLSLAKGDEYYCPCCNSEIGEFDQIGLDLDVIREKRIIGAGLRNGGCPVCFSSDRERLALLFLRDKTDTFSNKKLRFLHIAPERTLFNILKQRSNVEYVAGDLFTEGYDYPDGVVNMNVKSLDFEDNSFDILVCNHVLEHVPDDKQGMSELYRVLKPGGIALMQVPISVISDETYEDFSITDPKEREQHFGQFDHVRVYGRDYMDRLQSVGFKMKKVNLFRNDRSYARYAINPLEDLYVGTK